MSSPPSFLTGHLADLDEQGVVDAGQRAIHSRSPRYSCTVLLGGRSFDSARH